MPLLRAFCCVGNLKSKQLYALLFVAIGILGGLILLFGLFQPTAQIYFIIGAALLLTTAAYFKLIYFVALEMILIAGHSAILLSLGPVLPAVLPVLLSLQLFVYYFLSGQIQNIFILVGIAGIALLSIGFSYTDHWIFFFGSLSISVFAFYQAAHGKKIALIWAILNLIFALVSALVLLSTYFGAMYG